jgi:hypothetical protein
LLYFKPSQLDFKPIFKKNMTAGYLSLVSYATQDTYFYGNPSISFFSTVLMHPTPCIRYTLTTVIPELAPVNRASEDKLSRPYSVVVSNGGDMLCALYLNITYVNFRSDLNNPCLYDLIDRVELNIGDECVSTLWGEYIRIHQEQCLSRQAAMGAHDMAFLKSAPTIPGGAEHTASIALPFWFSAHVSQALPLVALSRSNAVKVTITFNPLSSTILTKTNQTVDNSTTFSIRKISLSADYLLLGKEERNAFASRPVSYLMTNVEYRPAMPLRTDITEQSTYERYVHTIPLSNKKPVKEIFWFIHDNTNNSGFTGTGIYTGNHWRDFTPLFDQMIEAAFYANNRLVSKVMPAEHYRSILPSKFGRAASLPYTFVQTTGPAAEALASLNMTWGRGVYYYSFSTSPSTCTESTGCVDLEALDSFALQFSLNFSDAASKSVSVFVLTYSVAKFSHGQFEQQ